MSKLTKLARHQADGLSIEVTNENTTVMSGNITSLEPSARVQPFLKSVHTAALADKLTELLVDVRQLAFVNSSAIRLFIDWATWLQTAPTGERYKLVFITDKSITWQRTSFVAIKSLAGTVVEVRT
jgi:hypothetical protein